MNAEILVEVERYIADLRNDLIKEQNSSVSRLFNGISQSVESMGIDIVQKTENIIRNLLIHIVTNDKLTSDNICKHIDVVERDSILKPSAACTNNNYTEYEKMQNLKMLCHIPNLEKILELNPLFGHPYGVVIAEHVKMGRNCVLFQNITIDKNIEDTEDEANYPVIGDNVTICAGAVVVGKVKVGNNVMIGANAVVVNDIEDNCLVVGNPAKVIRKIEGNNVKS